MIRSILLFSLLLLSSLAGAQNSITVMSYNIRCNTASDGVNSWSHRKEILCRQLKDQKVDIFGVQEALYDQMQDIKERMQGYDYIGVGREDGNINGEFSAIFYKTSRFELLESSTFWLSPTPKVPSKGWDAALNRICTWGRFKDLSTKSTFIHFNTHFDHKGEKARKESAILLLDKINELAGKKDPVILTGDFNLKPNEKPIELIRQRLRDARQVSLTPAAGSEGTFNGFDPKSELDARIDYIFVNKFVDVKTFTTLNQLFDGHFASDHFPVKAEIGFK